MFKTEAATVNLSLQSAHVDVGLQVKRGVWLQTLVVSADCQCHMLSLNL